MSRLWTWKKSSLFFSQAVVDLTVLTLGRFDTDKVYVTPTVGATSVLTAEQSTLLPLTHCTGLSVIRCCLPCQMMMWLGIEVRRTLALESITLQRITRLSVLCAPQH